MVKTRLPEDIQSGITSPLMDKGWGVYLFDSKAHTRYSASELDYNYPYTIFSSAEEYLGQLAIARRMSYPVMKLLRGRNTFVWRERTEGGRKFRFSTLIKIPVGSEVFVFYFVPRQINVEIYMHRPVITQMGEFDIDGMILPYNDFLDSIPTINPYE